MQPSWEEHEEAGRQCHGAREAVERRPTNLPTQGATANPVRKAARVPASSGRTAQSDWGMPGGNEARQTPDSLGKGGRVTAHASRWRNRTLADDTGAWPWRKRRRIKPLAASEAKRASDPAYWSAELGKNPGACALRARRRRACALRSAGWHGNEEQLRDGATRRRGGLCAFVQQRCLGLGEARVLREAARPGRWVVLGREGRHGCRGRSESLWAARGSCLPCAWRVVWSVNSGATSNGSAGVFKSSMPCCVCIFIVVCISCLLLT